MAESQEIAPEDRELFRQSVGEVVPVKQDRVPSPLSRPAPVPAKTHADEQAVMTALALGDFEPEELHSGDTIQFKRPGVQERVFQKLRRGQFSIEAELDLHGMTLDAARQALAQFLATARGERQRCVRIIHGKGRGSPDGRPIIKIRLQGWLQQRNEVLAYCSARARDGGTGAVYALIKKRSQG
jgi:DNA-nicking Smr family endonuclease